MLQDHTSQKEIMSALFKVQQAAEVIKKTADNTYHKSKYADLPEVWLTIKELLSENNLVVTHLIRASQNGDILKTQLYHLESGQFIYTECTLPLGKNTAQEYGSCITYLRRYQIVSLLGLITDDDDDGNEASEEKPKQEAPKPKPLTLEEYDEIHQALDKATSLEELQIGFDKFNASRKRLTKEQREQLLLVKSLRKDELAKK